MTPDEFGEVLQAKNIEIACPVCRAADWRGVEDLIQLPVQGTTKRYQGQGNPTELVGVSVIAPSCGRCGHVRLFDVQFLRAG